MALPHATACTPRYLLAVAVAGDGLLVGASTGHAGRDGALYRFDRHRFVRCHGLPAALHGAVGPRQIAADGDRAVVALPDGDLYASDDGGSEWAPLATGLKGVSEVVLVSG